MKKHKHAIRVVGDNGLVLMLLFFTALLFLLNFITSMSGADKFVSAEVKFLDASASGLGLTPASCASSPSYYHIKLTATTDGKGYVLHGQDIDAGILAPYLGVYICIDNNFPVGYSYFVPALTASEYNTFKSLHPSSTWTQCATEGATCTPAAPPKTVRYGALTKFIYRTVNSSIVCSAAAFGEDPIPGTTKKCYYGTGNRDGMWAH